MLRSLGDLVVWTGGGGALKKSPLSFLIPKEKLREGRSGGSGPAWDAVILPHLLYVLVKADDMGG